MADNIFKRAPVVGAQYILIFIYTVILFSFSSNLPLICFWSGSCCVASYNNNNNGQKKKIKIPAIGPTTVNLYLDSYGHLIITIK